ncbi:MAG TPA: hypothetical protein VN930_00290 [Xanthobacteraceae bacterium]|nr:hypothetical protein [Xanthobacteraceae bacterium]
MRNTIKTLVLATALATSGAGLAMAQAVPIDAVDEAPDTVYNPNAHFAYGVPAGYNGGYRTRAMLGAYNVSYPVSTPPVRTPQSVENTWFDHGSNLGEY